MYRLFDVVNLTILVERRKSVENQRRKIDFARYLAGYGFPRLKKFCTRGYTLQL